MTEDFSTIETIYSFKIQNLILILNFVKINYAFLATSLLYRVKRPLTLILLVLDFYNISYFPNVLSHRYLDKVPAPEIVSEPETLLRPQRLPKTAVLKRKDEEAAENHHASESVDAVRAKRRRRNKIMD